MRGENGMRKMRVERGTGRRKLSFLWVNGGSVVFRLMRALRKDESGSSLSISFFIFLLSNGRGSSPSP